MRDFEGQHIRAYSGTSFIHSGKTCEKKTYYNRGKHTIRSPKNLADSTIVDIYVIRSTYWRGTSSPRLEFMALPRLRPESAASLGGALRQKILMCPLGENRCSPSSSWAGAAGSLFSYCIVCGKGEPKRNRAGGQRPNTILPEQNMRRRTPFRLSPIKGARTNSWAW